MTDSATGTLDPDVRAMREAEDDRARAAVLLTAPVFTLMRWRPVFRHFCRRAQFAEGEAYLDALADALSRRRHNGVLSGGDHESAKMPLLYLAETGTLPPERAAGRGA